MFNNKSCFMWSRKIIKKWSKWWPVPIYSFICNVSNVFTYCYHLVNVINLSLSQTDHIKQLLLSNQKSHFCFITLPYLKVLKFKMYFDSLCFVILKCSRNKVNFGCNGFVTLERFEIKVYFVFVKFLMKHSVIKLFFFFFISSSF
jgi:hypothetical protein